MMEFFSGMFIFSGLLFVAAAIDKVAKCMADANELKRVELRASGVEPS